MAGLGGNVSEGLASPDRSESSDTVPQARFSILGLNQTEGGDCPSMSVPAWEPTSVTPALSHTGPHVLEALGWMKPGPLPAWEVGWGRGLGNRSGHGNFSDPD